MTTFTPPTKPPGGGSRPGSQAEEPPFLRTPLAPDDVALLRVMGVRNGFSLGVYCQAAGLPSDNRGRAIAHGRMKHMAREGLVRPMDDERPTIWLRTAKGTAEIAARTAEGDV